MEVSTKMAFYRTFGCFFKCFIVVSFWLSVFFAPLTDHPASYIQWLIPLLIPEQVGLTDMSRAELVCHNSIKVSVSAVQCRPSLQPPLCRSSCRFKSI